MLVFYFSINFLRPMSCHDLFRNRLAARSDELLIIPRGHSYIFSSSINITTAKRYDLSSTWLETPIVLTNPFRTLDKQVLRPIHCYSFDWNDFAILGRPPEVQIGTVQGFHRSNNLMEIRSYNVVEGLNLLCTWLMFLLFFTYPCSLDVIQYHGGWSKKKSVPWT